MTPKKAAKKKTAAKASPKAVKKAAPAKYIFAVGRRKTAQAKVKFYPQGSGEFTINDRAFTHYFPTFDLQQKITAPLEILGLAKKVNINLVVTGGGTHAQAEAARLGIARALLKADPASKTVLKKHGLLTRDARKKERKKPGLKRARRAPQWQKR